MADYKIFHEAGAFWDHVKHVFQEVDPTALVVSGGSAAKLADQGLDFAGRDIYIADERYVAEDHPESNAGLWGSKLQGQGTLHTWQTDRLGWEESAQIYAQNLPDHLNLTFLGIGPDGHTASLFPGDPILDSEALAQTSVTEFFAVEQRLSLTFRALEKSEKILVLMMGAGKKEIFEALQDTALDFHDFPARRLAEWDQVEVCFLDV